MLELRAPAKVNLFLRVLGRETSGFHELETLFVEARGLAVQGASDTYDSQQRAALADQIDQFLEHAVSLSESRYRGRYIFAGTQTSEPPYAATRVDGSIVMHDGLKFYVVDGETVYTGNEDEVTLGDGGATAPGSVTADLTTLFGAFRQEYEGVDLDELTDPETLRKLEELGYVGGGAGEE